MAKIEGPKRPLKEKIVQIYEAFLQGDDPSLDNINFWDEFFLLRVETTSKQIYCELSRTDHLTGTSAQCTSAPKPNLSFLESQFEIMTYEEVNALKITR
ncbi:UNVERIFIED_CONTAM: hypothetical protein NCL1_21608 [Trichonephila clavipes]